MATPLRLLSPNGDLSNKRTTHQSPVNAPAGILKTGNLNPTCSPVVNKLLALQIGNDSLTSASSSPGSPLNDSGKKLRDLPHTTTLKGCVAYVDVWSTDATDNRSSVFRNFLSRMGATVARKFTKDQPLTHVVFKNGHKSVLQKAQKRNIKVVTCLWVDRCRVLQEWVDEEEYLFDPTDYKPPKRFIEMQPQEPEELVRKSAESLKRRKARFAKKNARIMFQSPLVTNCRSTNGTPKDENGKEATKKLGILAADTPFQLPSLARYFSPSIVEETPLPERMQRMMQRLKEGKRVFSPPSSEDESDSDEPSPGKPQGGDMPSFPQTSSTEVRPKFSPVPDTQHYKRSWRESGISPPKFDVSCDEIPETQQMEAPDTPEELVKRTIPDLIDGIREVPETQPMSVSLLSNMETKMPDLPLFSSTTKDPNSPQGPCVQPLSEIPLPLLSQEDATMTDLHLQVSGESTQLENVLPCQQLPGDKENDDSTPLEQKVPIKPFVTSRKKKRKLLLDDDWLEPASVLISPQDSGKRLQSKQGERTSMVLPELGFSAYKTVAQSGRFFSAMPSNTPSELSYTSSQTSLHESVCNTQSTEYEADSQADLNLDNSLCLYDRIKMRKKRSPTNSFVVELSVKVRTPAKTKKRRRDSDGCSSGTVKKKAARTQVTPTQKKSPLFYSQAARAIMSSMKKRRSTIDFRSPTNFTKKTKLRKVTKKSVVLTNFHTEERFEAHKAIRQLSSVRVTSEVQDQTTHLVCGAPRRTVNIFRATARGLWVLSKKWITDSLSAGFWLSEESYEVQSAFPTAQRNRICRTQNPMWKNELFSNYDGYIYVADDTKPPQNEIKELILLCGGRVVGSARRAALCVGNPGRQIPQIPVVRETWVLDCIMEHVIKPLDSYLIDT